MAIEIGQILDKYELIEKVGQGGMAVVYRGYDRSLKRPVAVKILHSHLAEFEEARTRFEREAHAVAKLRHENIL
ncbi:MAG: protein kinase, partial [Myxococcota bacterium]